MCPQKASPLARFVFSVNSFYSVAKVVVSSTSVRSYKRTQFSQSLSVLLTAHPCNMKEFKLYVGLSEDNMTEVLHTGLKNDTLPETFTVRSINRAGLTFPSRYVKIEPLSYALLCKS